MIFFFYGTLRRGHEVMPDAAHLGEAKIRGELYMVGENYPGLIPTRGNQWARGDLYRIDSAETVRRLDEYEGEQYRRKRSAVYRDSGERMLAWTYYYRGAVQAERRIESGDFLRRRRQDT